MTKLHEKILSRSQVEARIANGAKIFILGNQVIKADAWLPFHPGGETAILHMVGRDGTDEIRALHSEEAQQRMQRFAIGKVESPWINFTPPIQGGSFKPLDEQSGLDKEEKVVEESSSSNNSGALTPVFDTAQFSGKCNGDRRHSAATSISSASSVSIISNLNVAPELMVGEEEICEDERDDRSEALPRDHQYPSLDLATQNDVAEKYRILNDQIYKQGLYNCSYTSYLIEVLRYSILLMAFILLLRSGHVYLSAVSLGLLWHQLVFTAHDAGHMGITHSFQIDTCIGIVIADFIGGLSIGWWKRNHNVHHIVTNSPEHDPDIEHMPFFAISPRFLLSLRSTYYDKIMAYDGFARRVLPLQNWLYYPILTMGRFNLYRLSWAHLIFFPGPHKGPARWHRYFEILGQMFFWYWFGYLTVYRGIETNRDRVILVLISHMLTAILHVQITLSHFAMSTTDLGPHESFAQRMLRTTMDVDCPPWLDFFHGGLQFQAIHHLYPRIPRHNLRKCQKLVVAFCEDVGIPYARFSFIKGNCHVLGRLKEVADQARLLEQCRQVMVKGKT